MESNPIIELQKIEGKGKGYIAKRDIKFGEVILTETPLTAIYKGSDVQEAINNLANQVLKHPLYESLSYNPSHLRETDSLARARAITRTNGFRSQNNDEYHLSVSPECSFFNHSCYPNAAIHTKNEQKNLVIAIEDIKKGDEITICYRGELLHLPKSRRQEVLKKEWNFTCNCSRCQNPPPNDALLLQSDPMKPPEIENMQKLYIEINAESEEPTPEWLDLCDEFLRLPLDQTHWRKIQVRYLMILVYSHPQTGDARKARKLLETNIKAMKLVVPKYHNSKVSPFLSYIRLVGNEKEALESLQKIDDSCLKVLELFT